MAGIHLTPITIKEAIDKIDAREYLLPAIQRRFVWDKDRIEMLFDSIMREYPINSFMLWEVKSDEVKNNFKFYQFLNEYREFFKESNPEIGTAGYRDFFAVIDGQQRLTSLYLGLKGTCAWKVARMHWKDDERALPTRTLYLNLACQLPENNERQMQYDFQLLTKKELERKVKAGENFWFKVGDILGFREIDAVDDYIEKHGHISSDFYKKTLRKLYRAMHQDRSIQAYLETTQKIDTVLDVFVRTNSGGEPLSFSDLLMSMTTAHWTSDARREISDLVDKVFKIGNPGFVISKDLILKACLVLLGESISFKVHNFGRSQAVLFEANWEKIKTSILAAFQLAADLGFNDQNLKAKNAILPIVYYIYHANLEEEITNRAKRLDDKKLIQKWLCISILKGVFGGHADTTLTSLRKVIREMIDSAKGAPKFPYNAIKEVFKADPAKNLSFDDEFIDGLLKVQKDSPDCYSILSLIYSHLNFTVQPFHKDHLHPQKYFENLKKTDFSSEDDYVFYTDPENWNSVANLQLLNAALNQSKLATPLKEWVRKNKIDKSLQLIPDVSLETSDFRGFIDSRRRLLKDILKSKLE